MGRSAHRPGRPSPPRHWGESQTELACKANRLMLELGCPLSGQPELKGQRYGWRDWVPHQNEGFRPSLCGAAPLCL